MQTAHRVRIAQVFLSSLVATAAAVCGLSCNETAQPTQATAQPAVAPALLPVNAPIGILPAAPAATAAQVHADTVAAVAPKPKTDAASIAAAASSPMPTVPAGARWTIFCMKVIGIDHVRGANATKEQLVGMTKRGDWYLIHGRDESNIYFGFYKAVESPKASSDPEVARAQADLESIKGIVARDQTKPFEHSVFVSLEAPDPTAPPDWNLANVDRSLAPHDPKRAYWSLQIMAFRANEKRKEAAIEAVRELRAQGVEAYYYHGQDISSVCVGHWQADALKAQNRTDEMQDVVHAGADSNLAFIDVPTEENIKARPIDGKPTIAVSPKIEILDASMKEMMDHFPHNAVNYEEGKAMPSGEIIYNPSFLVVIPRPKGNGLYDSPDPSSPPIAGKRRGGPTALSPPSDRLIGSNDGRLPNRQ